MRGFMAKRKYFKQIAFSCLIFTLLIIFHCPVLAGENKIFLAEEFNDLSLWEPLNFEKIPRHSSYTVVSEGVNNILKMKSSASASGMTYKEIFNVYEYPVLKWRWKIENVYKKGDALSKEGDDYPVRIYVIFKYDPDKAGVFEKAKYKLAKMVYGKYPPHSSLNYIWANRKHSKTIIKNAFTKKAIMFVVETGDEKTGRWIEEEVDMLADYKKAFGEEPPAEASLAVMNDSDNTGESSVSYIDFIKVITK